MHPYMIKSFEPTFGREACLNGGDLKAISPDPFCQRFKEIACVESSNKAIEEAQYKLSNQVACVH